MKSQSHIAVFSPDNLTDPQVDKMIDIIDELSDESHFHIGLYRTMEEDILKYLLSKSEVQLSSYTIYLNAGISYTSEVTQMAINTLKQKGLKVVEQNLATSFDEGNTISRNVYKVYVKQVLESCNEVLSFYNEDPKQISKLFVPLNRELLKNKRGYLCNLNQSGNVELV